jgi:hypothetical protein
MSPTPVQLAFIHSCHDDLLAWYSPPESFFCLPMHESRLPPGQAACPPFTAAAAGCFWERWVSLGPPLGRRPEAVGPLLAAVLLPVQENHASTI